MPFSPYFNQPPEIRTSFQIFYFFRALVAHPPGAPHLPGRLSVAPASLPSGGSLQRAPGGGHPPGVLFFRTIILMGLRPLEPPPRVAVILGTSTGLQPDWVL